MHKRKKRPSSVLEKARRKGRKGDSMLAHINPMEAMLLKQMGGSGTINPKTGLPEFSIFKSPKKWIKSVMGPTVGIGLGNMVLPGIGGVIGGGIGGAMGSAARGRKDIGKAALRGGALGAMTPSLASLGGGAASSLGATGVGETLTNYGTENSILAALGLGDSGLAKSGSNAMNASRGLSSSNKKNMSNTGRSIYDDLDYDDLDYNELYNTKGNNKDYGFMDKLQDKSSDFLADPQSWLSLGTLGLSIYDRKNKEKPLTAKERGKASKEEQLASRLTPEELAEEERYNLALEQARRRIARKKFLPEERIQIDPLYSRVNSPEEYRDTGRWISYYNNPEFTGRKVRF